MGGSGGVADILPPRAVESSYALCPRIVSCQAWLWAVTALVENHFYIWALFQVHGVDEADLAVVVCKDQGMGPSAFAEEAHAAEQSAAGDASTRENNFISGREIFGGVDALSVFDAHLGEALVVLGLGRYQARENLAVQAAQSSGGENAFWRSTGAHDGVDAGANYCGADSGGEVAVGDEPDASASGSNPIDQFFMARAVEHDDDKVFDFAVEALGN